MSQEVRHGALDIASPIPLFPSSLSSLSRTNCGCKRMQGVVEPCQLPTNPKEMHLSDFTKSYTMALKGESVYGIRLGNPELW